MSPSSPKVILVPRPELDMADLIVVRRNPHGDRYAFTADHGWQLVATGAEAPVLARLTLWHCAVDLLELDRALEPVRRDLRAAAL
jgi:hypothetical protein